MPQCSIRSFTSCFYSRHSFCLADAGLWTCFGPCDHCHAGCSPYDHDQWSVRALHVLASWRAFCHSFIPHSSCSFPLCGCRCCVASLRRVLLCWTADTGLLDQTGCRLQGQQLQRYFASCRVLRLYVRAWAYFTNCLDVIVGYCQSICGVVLTAVELAGICLLPDCANHNLPCGSVVNRVSKLQQCRELWIMALHNWHALPRSFSWWLEAFCTDGQSL